MDDDYLSHLRAERLKMLKDHTRLTMSGYPALASFAWDAVKRLTKEIKREERKSVWWN